MYSDGASSLAEARAGTLPAVRDLQVEPPAFTGFGADGRVGGAGNTELLANVVNVYIHHPL